MTNECIDIVNSIFGIFAVFAITGHIRQIKKDKEIKGVYAPTILFYFIWGLWDMYYYSALNQWFSFNTGALAVIADSYYIYLVWKFRKNDGNV